MSRVDYGEGSVFWSDSRGLYFATYIENGQRKRVSAKTRKGAIAKRKTANARIDRGMKGVSSRHTFNDEAQRWKDVASKTMNLTHLSRQNYLDVLRLHVLPKLGPKRIDAILPSDVEQVLVAMADAGLSPSYRHQAHKAMSHIFKMAMRDRLITMNPTRSIPAPRGNVKKRVVPTRDSIVELISRADEPRLRVFLEIAAHTGLRISEVLALTWADVNHSTKTISVLGKGGKRRAVYLTPTLSKSLKAWKRQQAATRLASPSWASDSEWIITTDIGTQMDSHNWRKKFFNPLRDEFAPGVTPHSLRHAFATIMLEEDVPMKVVSAQMGHSSTRITEETYSHVTARLTAAAGEAVERALGGA